MSDLTLPNKSDWACKICKKQAVWLQYTNRARLEQNQTCFSCDFWMEKFDKCYMDPRYVVIDGVMYRAEDGLVKTNHKEDLGFGGREFKILKHDGALIHTNNMWDCGEIPPQFRVVMVDNARFVNGEKWVDCGNGQKALG